MKVFDWKFYCNAYSDLYDCNFNESQAINHWNTYGKNEGRIGYLNLSELELEDYENFDWVKYNISYKDTNFFKTKEQAILHWLQYGKNEGRTFFTYILHWFFYTNCNMDLIEDDINTENKAVYHWNTQGKKEKRIYITIPDYFDWKFYVKNYIKNNNDIDNENKAWHYYLINNNKDKLYLFNNYNCKIIDECSNEMINIFTDLLNNDKPCWISRIGGSDFDLFNELIKKKFILNYKDTKLITNIIRKYNGYFDYNNDPIILQKSKEIYNNSCLNSDLLLVGNISLLNDILKFKNFNNIHFNLNNKILTHYGFIEGLRPFLNSFKVWGENKKILIISPFEDTIKYQTNKNRINNHFKDYIFPDCEFLTYKTPITYNSDDNLSHYYKDVTKNYNNWIELGEKMIDDLSKINFDIAFISAGIYSMFLGDKIKCHLGKKAIYIGGVLNVIFNFYGERYDYPGINELKNLDYQIEIIDDFKDLLLDNNLNNVKNEVLRAYFRIK